MDLKKTGYFIKEAMLFLLLIMVVPPLISTIIGWIDNERDYREDLFVSKVLFLLLFIAYFLTPLTAKIKKFGRLNKWGKFFIIYVLMSFV